MKTMQATQQEIINDDPTTRISQSDIPHNNNNNNATPASTTGECSGTGKSPSNKPLPRKGNSPKQRVDPKTVPHAPKSKQNKKFSGAKGGSSRNQSRQSRGAALVGQSVADTVSRQSGDIDGLREKLSETIEKVQELSTSPSPPKVEDDKMASSSPPKSGVDKSDPPATKPSSCGGEEDLRDFFVVSYSTGRARSLWRLMLAEAAVWFLYRMIYIAILFCIAYYTLDLEKSCELKYRWSEFTNIYPTSSDWSDPIGWIRYVVQKGEVDLSRVGRESYWDCPWYVSRANKFLTYRSFIPTFESRSTSENYFGPLFEVPDDSKYGFNGVNYTFDWIQELSYIIYILMFWLVRDACWAAYAVASGSDVVSLWGHDQTHTYTFREYLNDPAVMKGLADLRADVISQGGLKHKDPKYAWVTYRRRIHTFVSWTKDIIVSVEVLSQLQAGKFMGMQSDDTTTHERLEKAASALHSVNQDRHITMIYSGQFPLAYTVRVAYAMWKQMQENLAELPFQPTPA